MKIVRKLYDWVLHWSQTPYGPIALFILAFAEASFFPIPPDALLIALILGHRKKAFSFALNCTVASVLGAMLGYVIGHFLWWSGPNEFSSLALFFFNNIPGFTEKIFFDVKALYEEWNFWIIFTAGFTPIPYKVFTISGGAFEINLIMFILASIISRAGRFFLVALLIWKFGEQIKGFIDKYFNWLAVAFTVLLLGGFVVIKYLL
ncbi:MAG: DedA family protein [Melioribacteraceae bacterium]|nr:DedA family protein [Melioribacteraceae bacterium]